MNVVRRQRIAWLMSLVLTIFSICQVQARAALLPEPAPAASMDMADCHHAGSDTASLDCHDVCKHLQQYKDLAQKLPAPDAIPRLLAFLEPFAVPVGGLAGADGYRPPDPLSTDPPASIRFQRFLN